MGRFVGMNGSSSRNAGGNLGGCMSLRFHNERNGAPIALKHARACSIVLEQGPRLDLETYCNPGNVVDRHVALGPFNGAEICSVDSAFVRQGFLTSGHAQHGAGAYSSPVCLAEGLYASFSRTQSSRLLVLRRPLLSYIRSSL